MENVIIIWWWPAGHAAAIYTARAGLKPLLFEWFMAGWLPPGGQLTLTADVENFPGFPVSLTGLELMNQMRQQSIKFWVKIETKTIDRVDFSRTPFKLWSWETEYQAKSVIIATGASAKRLQIEWSNKFRERGISACATCDGGLPVFRDQVLVVVGGWDAACSEALFLSRFASKIIMLVRKDNLKATKIMQDKVVENSKIQILYNTEVIECLWDQSLSAVKIKNNQSWIEEILDCRWLFYAIWHTPNTDFVNDFLTIDADGYLITDGVKTNISGIFAAGDVQDKVYRQAITSAGTGAMAGIEVDKFLQGI